MTQRSGLALAVLSLATEQPMHPYRMQQLLRERHKEEVVNVGQRSQLYKTIDRLVRDGLLVARATEREHDRPERTVYAPTDAGRATVLEWTVGMLTEPRADFPEFVVGLSYLPAITPEQALTALSTRLAALRADLERRRAVLAGAPGGLPRVVLVDDEYLTARLEADVTWLARLVDDLETGALTWDFDQLLADARKYDPPPTE